MSFTKKAVTKSAIIASLSAVLILLIQSACERFHKNMTNLGLVLLTFLSVFLVSLLVFFAGAKGTIQIKSL